MSRTKMIGGASATEWSKAVFRFGAIVKAAAGVTCTATAIPPMTALQRKHDATKADFARKLAREAPSMPDEKPIRRVPIDFSLIPTEPQAGRMIANIRVARKRGMSASGRWC
jgi:hypothetical protein